MLAALRSVERRSPQSSLRGRTPGSNARLAKAAENVDYPGRALRFVENVYDYMHAADAFVTKPGGLTTAEALVAQVPIVLCKPLPGQEERNARVLVEAGAALRTRRIDELPAAVESVLTDDAAPRRE